MKQTVVGIGNCQTEGLARCAGSALGLPFIYLHPLKSEFTDEKLEKVLSSAKVVFAQSAWAPKMRDMMTATRSAKTPVIAAPRLFFPGFHPDMATPAREACNLNQLPMGNANSAILLAAWAEGLSVGDAISLFRGEVFQALGYFETFDAAASRLVTECRAFGIDAASLMLDWERPFFYVPLHPKIAVLNDIALTLLRNAGVSTEDTAPPSDPLASNVIWPVYPEIGERLGIAGDYLFRPNQKSRDGAVEPMKLDQFVERTFEAYQIAPPNLSHFPRMSDPQLQLLSSFLTPRTYHEVGSIGWLDNDAAEAMKVICDEELLDPNDE